MEAANQEIESEAHKETNPLIVANSNLAKGKSVAIQDSQPNRDGRRFPQDKENYPLRRQVESNTIDRSAETRVLSNLDHIVRRPPMVQLGSPRPTSLNPPRFRQQQPIIASTSANHHQLEANSVEDDPIITDLDAPPDPQLENLVGCEEDLRIEQPCDATIRSQVLDNQRRQYHANMEMDS